MSPISGTLAYKGYELVPKFNPNCMVGFACLISEIYIYIDKGDIYIIYEFYIIDISSHIDMTNFKYLPRKSLFRRSVLTLLSVCRTLTECVLFDAIP